MCVGGFRRAMSSKGDQRFGGAAFSSASTGEGSAGTS